jgi:hypothetical protein
LRGQQLVRRVLRDGIAPNERLDAGEVLESLLECGLFNSFDVGDLVQACRSSRSADVLHVPSFLCDKSCEALRNAVELDEPSGTPDSVDKLPEHQIVLSADGLRALIGAEDVDRIMKLPDTLRAQQQAAGAAAWDMSGVTANRRVDIVIRRYTRDTRPCLGFHRDSSTFTVNIACADDASHTGGRLVWVENGVLRTLDRRAGEATVHSSSMLHAVTAMQSGVRYSLVLFFHDWW